MEKNIFKDAKMGDMYVTRCGSKVIFLSMQISFSGSESAFVFYEDFGAKAVGLDGRYMPDKSGGAPWMNIVSKMELQDPLKVIDIIHNEIKERCLKHMGVGEYDDAGVELLDLQGFIHDLKLKIMKEG